MKMKGKIKNRYELEKLDRYKSKRGLKTSVKRSSIVEYFLREDRHFSAEDLYNEIKKINPGVSYSTVYRALKLLADCGLAEIRYFRPNVARFEPVHKAKHHDHLICMKCGQIIEFSHKGIEKFQKMVAGRHNFFIKFHKLELYGLCKKCCRKEKK